jgi:hypothetical protein
MKKDTLFIFLGCLLSCGISTFTPAKARDPGHLTIGYGTSGATITSEVRGERSFSDGFPYARLGLFKNFEIGFTGSPYALLGAGKGTAYLKYQFLSGPCGSFILGGSVTLPCYPYIPAGIHDNIKMITGSVLFGDPGYFGIKLASVYLYQDEELIEDGHYYAVGPIIGGTTLGRFKLLLELQGIYSLMSMETGDVHVFGGSLGIGFQYDF